MGDGDVFPGRAVCVKGIEQRATAKNQCIHAVGVGSILAGGSDVAASVSFAQGCRFEPCQGTGSVSKAWFCM